MLFYTIDLPTEPQAVRTVWQLTDFTRLTGSLTHQKRLGYNAIYSSMNIHLMFIWVFSSVGYNNIVFSKSPYCEWI